MLGINTAVIKALGIECYNMKQSTFTKIIIRSISGAIGGLMYFQALKYLPLSEATVLFRTAPIWTSIAVIFIMKKEKLTLSLVLNYIVCFFGILLVSKPP